MTKRTVVVHMIDELPPDGAERLIVDVLSKRSSEFDYRVLCLVRGGELQKDIEDLGVPVDVLGKRIGFDPSLIPKLIRYLKHHRVSVVHTHLFTADFWGRLAAKLAGVHAIFSTSHSENNWKSAVHRFLDRRMAVFSNAVIACTDQVKTVLVDRDGIADSTVTVVANGINLERFKSTEQCDLQREFGIGAEDCVLALIGRFHPVKGHLYFMDVFAQLCRQAQVHLLLVGDGDLRGQIEEKVAELGLTDKVSLAGFRRDVPAILNSVDVVVVPSELEGLPMVVLESMARGKAVVAHDVGGIADVIKNDRYGRLVQAGEPARMLSVLLSLVSEPKTIQAIGEQASALITSEFDATDTCSKYEALYRRALATS